MFRKLKAGLGGKGKAKFRLDVAVERVEGLPAGVSAARLQWARGAKVAVTKLVPASAGGRAKDSGRMLHMGWQQAAVAAADTNVSRFPSHPTLPPFVRRGCLERGAQPDCDAGAQRLGLRAQGLRVQAAGGCWGSFAASAWQGFVSTAVCGRRQPTSIAHRSSWGETTLTRLGAAGSGPVQCAEAARHHRQSDP